MLSEKHSTSSPTAIDTEFGDTLPLPTREDVRYAEVDETEAKVFGKTQRGLTSRHVQLITIGGSIGTGLFVGIGKPLATAGPLSVFLGFFLFSVFVSFPLMHIVAEMCSWLPIRGSTFHFAETYVEPAFGFAVGYIYWYGAVMFVCIEFTAVASVIEFWSSLNPAIWIAIGLAISVGLNIFAVKYYGEAEFISSSFKIMLIIGLIFLTIITMLGGNPHNDRYGFRNYREPGPMKPYLEEGPFGRFLGFWSTLIYAAFACGGPDILMMISGEVQDPRKNIPTAARKCFIRIALFYVVGTLCVGILCPSAHPDLLAALDAGAAGSAASPWVIGIKNLDIKGLDHLVNTIVMTSAWSCGNAYLYSSSRTLYALALQEKAPAWLKKCASNGVPANCVLVCALISCVSFLSISNATSTVFSWFVNLGTVSFLLTYMSIFLTYIRFMRAMRAQQVSRKALYHRTPFHVQPYAAYFGLVFCGLIVIFNGFDIFWPGAFQMETFFTCYFGVFFFIALYVVCKLWTGSRIWRSMEIDLWSGKQEIDDEDTEWEARHSGKREGGWKEKLYDVLF